MSRVRRFLLPIFCALLAALAAWWLLYVPYEPTRPFSAIPANAVFAGVHDRLADRLGDVLASPLTDALLSYSGLDRKWLETIENDPDVLKWLPRLAGRRVVIAYVPSLGNTGCEAWLISAWAGGYSQCLRWLASLNLVPNVTSVGEYAQRPVWKVKLPAKVAGRYSMSVSVAEGLVLVCVSRDPYGVRHMLDTLDGRAPIPSLPERNPMSGVSALIEGTAPDRGWAATALPTSYEITAQSQGQVAGRAWIRHRLRAGAALPGAANLKDAALLLGDIPEAVCLFEPEAARQLLLDLSKNSPGHTGSAWMKIMAETFEKAAAPEGGRACGFICLLGGEYRSRLRSLLPPDYSGPLKGLPAPVFMVGVRIADPVNAQALAGWVVDSLNAKYRLGIFPWPMSAGNYEVFGLEGTGEDQYSKLSVDERCAFSVCDGWLVFSTCTEALLKIVARFQRDESKQEAASCRWLMAYEAAETNRPVAFLWSDLDDACVTLKDGLGLWRLALAETENSESAKVRSLREDMAWMDTLRMLRHCAIGAAPAGNATELRFNFGDETGRGKTHTRAR